MKTFFDNKFWKLLCSLKLTIVLASAATLLSVGGSLLIPFNPQIFDGLDGMPLNLWIETMVPQAPKQTWWIPVGGVLVGLLALNTLCCFIDWLFHLRARWRKSGEYLIHLGFVLILIAFFWGSLAGFRSEGNGLIVGQSMFLPQLDVTLKLESFEPVFNQQGRPTDMRNGLAIYRGAQLLKRIQTQANHPLTWQGLVVIPASYGQTMWGGRQTLYSVLTINYDPGANLALAGGVTMGCGVLLALFSFYRKRALGDRPDII